MAAFGDPDCTSKGAESKSELSAVRRFGDWYLVGALVPHRLWDRVAVWSFL